MLLVFSLEFTHVKKKGPNKLIQPSKNSSMFITKPKQSRQNYHRPLGVLKTGLNLSCLPLCLVMSIRGKAALAAAKAPSMIASGPPTNV